MIKALLTVLLCTSTLVAATWTVDAGGGGDFTTIQAAIDSTSVVDGDTLDLIGTFAPTVTITVGKELTFNGQGTGTTVVTSTAILAFDVLASNVTFQNFTLTGTNTTATATLINTFQVTGFHVQNMEFNYMKNGLYLASSQYTIESSEFDVQTAPAGNTFAITALGNSGTSVVQNSVIDTTGTASTPRFFYATAGASEPYSGSLEISNIGQIGSSLFQFYFQNSFDGNPGDFSLVFDGNYVTATDAYVTFFVSQNNALDLFSSIVARNNQDTTVRVSNKGFIVLDGVGGPFDAASDPNAIFSFVNNQLTETAVTAAGYIAGAPFGLLGINSAVINAFTLVLQPTNLAVSQYVERFATQGDLVYVLKWTTTDPATVSYTLQRDGIPFVMVGAKPTTNTFHAHGQKSGKTVIFTIQGEDAAGNKSFPATITVN